MRTGDSAKLARGVAPPTNARHFCLGKKRLQHLPQGPANPPACRTSQVLCISLQTQQRQYHCLTPYMRDLEPQAHVASGVSLAFTPRQVSVHACRRKPSERPPCHSSCCTRTCRPPAQPPAPPAHRCGALGPLSSPPFLTTTVPYLGNVVHGRGDADRLASRPPG